ncbi:hypothetical protein OUZ56_016679 [Daphnia magna]|uniref:Uncharacterized protein n=1 Tax=Daphnia magna TaxID=35525 RepID=A0ABR0AR91_9CRUS|nr:hypothetical protein OUZ56_016679 [Daphnia magna]
MSKLVIHPHANGHHHSGTPRICEMEENTLSLRGPVVEVTSYRRSSQRVSRCLCTGNKSLDYDPSHSRSNASSAT